jgi:hypothetical protein
MAIDVRELRSRPLEPEIEAELDKFEAGVQSYLAGEIDDDAFRVFRSTRGSTGSARAATTRCCG